MTTQTTETEFATEVHISDDSGSKTYTTRDARTVEGCIVDYYGGKCYTVEDVREHLESADAYGFIEVDGERVLDVRP